MSDKDTDVVVINTNDEPEIDLELDGTEDAEALKVKLEEATKKLEQFPNIIARAKKAEAELKELKGAPAPKADATQNTNNNSLTEESVDVKILVSQGVDQESIEMLKKLAKVNGTSVLAAKEDPIYATYLVNKEAQSKSEKARLGASKGSGGGRVEKSSTTPNLSEADHKEIWRKSQGR